MNDVCDSVCGTTPQIQAYVLVSLRCMVDSLCCCARLNSKHNVLQVELKSPELADSLHLQQVVAVLGQQVLFILMKTC